MSIEDNDNLYVLEEEEDDFLKEDNSPKNYAAYPEEENEEVMEEEVAEEKSALSLLFTIMFNPVEGWKKLRRSKIKLEEVQSRCFYPVLALLALSKFADYIYSVNVSLSQVITEGVVSFVSFFFGYFCIQMFLSWVSKKDVYEKVDSLYGKEYITISLTTLAIFAILRDLLPMIWPILFFLPLWTIYLMFKGVRFFKIEPKREMTFYVSAILSVIGMPLLIDWALNSLLKL